MSNTISDRPCILRVIMLNTAPRLRVERRRIHTLHSRKARGDCAVLREVENDSISDLPDAAL